MIRPVAIALVVAGLAQAPVAAQEALSLAEAIARARTQHPDAGIAAAAEREASQERTQARAAFLPRLDLTESWQRGNQPVFVFSSLLSQRQFSDANFAIDALNRPDAIDNFRTAVVAQQPIYRAAARTAVSAATIAHDMATESMAVVAADLAVAVTEAYGRVLASQAAHRSATAAIDAARSDRELAGNRRDAGMATDADVLQLDVHVARAREREIRAVADERTARAHLNQLIGAPLDAAFAIALPSPGPAVDISALTPLRAEALRRPSVRIAAMGERLAAAQLTGAKRAVLPQLDAQGGWEFNGGTWASRSSSWVVGLTASVNLFHGLADRARLAEAKAAVTRAALERRKAEDAAALEVYAAAARLEAARASEAVAFAAVTQAREARRIIRDRYENGLADVTSLLRAAESVTDAETQHTSAQVAVLMETATLQRALGRP